MQFFVVQTFVPSPVCQYPIEDGDPIQGQHIRGVVSQGNIQLIQSFRSGILVILFVDQTNILFVDMMKLTSCCEKGTCRQDCKYNVIT